MSDDPQVLDGSITVPTHTSRDFISDDLEYLLGHRPTPGCIDAAVEWRTDNPNGDLAEWVETMIQIGAL